MVAIAQTIGYPYLSEFIEALINHPEVGDKLFDEFKQSDKVSLRDNKKCMQTVFPRYDVYELENSLIIVFAIPGIKKQDINLDYDKNTMVFTISGQIVPPEYITKDVNTRHKELYNGKFERNINLKSFFDRNSFTLDLDSVKASLEDGLLKVAIPKITQEKRKRIIVE